MNMLRRKIGDVSVPAIGFGAMGVGLPLYGSLDPDEERFQLLDAAYEQSCTHWDTAHIYGDSEELIGRWFKRTGKRDKIFLATKCGIYRSMPRGDPEFIREQFETSIQRLGVDTIDLFYLHRIASDIPIEVTMGAMVEFVKAGKVKYIGLSECSATTLRRAHAVHPIAAIQVEFSPFVLDIYDPKIGLLEAARELGVAIIAYSPLGRGLLTGRFKSMQTITEGLSPSTRRKASRRFLTLFRTSKPSVIPKEPPPPKSHLRGSWLKVMTSTSSLGPRRSNISRKIWLLYLYS